MKNRSQRIKRSRAKSFFAVYHVQRTGKNKAEVRGRERPGDIDVGDIILFPLGHEVAREIKSIEQREHRGHFKEPDDAKGSYFVAQCVRVDVPDEYKMK